MSEPAQTYAGLMAQLAQQADLLTRHGIALQNMGPLAPPCLAKPYRKYRDMVREQAGQLYATFKMQEGDTSFDALVAKTGGFQQMVDAMPEIIGTWSDAPDAWQPGAYELEGGIEVIPNPSIRGLRQSVELINYLRDGLRRGAPIGPLPDAMAAAEAVAGTSFLRGMWNLGKGAFRFVERRALPIWLTFEVGSWLWEQFNSPPPSDVATEGLVGGIFNNVKLFEEDYLPRTAQQWQAMVRIYRMSGGNHEIVRAMMEAWDPQKYEQPLNPRVEDFDIFCVADMMHIETRRTSKYAWTAIPILVAGVDGTIAAAGD